MIIGLVRLQIQISCDIRTNVVGLSLHSDGNGLLHSGVYLRQNTEIKTHITHKNTDTPNHRQTEDIQLGSIFGLNTITHLSVF